jgi:transcriptional regulator with XRE-family HTH domain
MAMKSVSEQIKQCRESLQMTKSELAVKAGLTPAAITQFEAGDREPSLESLKKLADALEVSVNFLIGRSNDDEFAQSPELTAMFRGMQKLSDADKKFMQAVYKQLLERNKAKKSKNDSVVKGE